MKIEEYEPGHSSIALKEGIMASLEMLSFEWMIERKNE